MKSLLAAAIFCFSAQLLAQTPDTTQTAGPQPNSPQIEQQVNEMLGKLSLHQKIELIGGVDSMYTHAEPAIGLPRLKMSDASLGVRTWGPSTAYAAGVALAASWDRNLAGEIGASLGRDARARGVNFLLGPGVNIYRAPMNGRNFEYLGEDPYLASQMVVPYIHGLQDQGVSATVKHFVANNSEYDRHNINSVVDERTLHELYLPAFEAAVKQGGVGAVMDSYNLVNGEHMTQNCPLNIGVLRKEWGFQGVLMSDWVATYDAVQAANCGLDLEMPSPQFLNEKNLMPAIQQGKVTQATIDDKVRDILRTALRFGFLQRDQLVIEDPLYSQQSNAVALDSARASITLLKNDGNLLPLDVTKIHTLAIIGPDAWPAEATGGGSGNVTPFAPSSFLTGISDYLGSRVKVLYAPGLPTAEDLFRRTSFQDADGKNTLELASYDNADFSGTPAISHPRNIAHWQNSMWMPPSQKPRAMRYTATYTPKTSGRFMVLAAAGGDDRCTVSVNGKEVLRLEKREGHAPQSAVLDLQAGVPAKIQIDYLPSADTERIGFGIRAVDDLLSPETKKVAAAADAVLMPVGFDSSTESEGFDRTFDLPWGQNELINAVAAANKRTIVTLTAGGAVNAVPWIDHVPALLHNYYPGQAGGRAMAEILFGERAPEGRLPFSFDKVWADDPTHDHYYPEPAKPGQPPTVTYAEGLMVGYRYYTSEGKQPLFPFGYGLGYTTFTIANLAVDPKQTNGDQPVSVTFDVTNTGHRDGAEVAQVYLGLPSDKVKMPARELKGFEKVVLHPGETKHVTVRIDRGAFSYWDTAKHDWQVDPGRVAVYVGDSSEHTPLTASFTVAP